MRSSRCPLNECWIHCLNICRTWTLCCTSLARNAYSWGVYRPACSQKCSEPEQQLSCCLKEEIAPDKRLTGRKGKGNGITKGVPRVLCTLFHAVSTILWGRYRSIVHYQNFLGPMCFGIETFLEFEEIICCKHLILCTQWSGAITHY